MSTTEARLKYLELPTFEIEEFGGTLHNCPKCGSYGFSATYRPEGYSRVWPVILLSCRCCDFEKLALPRDIDREKVKSGIDPKWAAS